LTTPVIVGANKGRALPASQARAATPSEPSQQVVSGIAGIPSAFTPGPWRYRPQEHDDWGIVRASPDEYGFSEIICQARSPRRTNAELSDHRRDGTDPWEATARLIAAAPELFEALVGISRVLLPINMILAQAECVDEPLADDAVLLSFMGSGASDHVTAGEYRVAAAKLNAAISKALGQHLGGEGL
jgi:hypothetical protein